MTEKRFNCHVKFSAMPNGIMVLDYERHGDEQTVIEDISREKAHRVMDRLNELSEENKQLKQQNKELKLDNDIKFWKHQFMMKYNTTQLIMHELAKAIEDGYEVSSEFQKYLDELKTRDSENSEKMERLRI